MNFVQPGRIQAQGRAPLNKRGGQASQPLTYPAPTLGLVTATDIAGAQEGSASVLINFIPTLKGARIRGGSLKKGLLAGGATVQTAFTYKYGTVQRMFMATNTAIFDVTSPAVPPATTAAAVTGLTSGNWSTFQQTTTGGSFLLAFNGSDARRVFDGTTWATTPALTFSDSTTSNAINFGWTFKNRQWLIKNASLDAYYLPVNAIGGAAVVFPLGGVMQKGGSLLAGFTWSVESGDGPNDMCVFLSTEGEVAVYSGSDPASATDFQKRGLYQIGKPLGKNAIVRAGADVLIATVDGFIPLSQVFARDRATLSLTSSSRPIEDDWRAAAQATGFGWSITQWPEMNLLFITYPSTVAAPDQTFVMNTQTGKWGIIRNWSARDFASIQGALFFGSTGGTVWQGDITGTDDDMSFSAVYLSFFATAGTLGQRKTGTLASMQVRARTKPNLKLFARGNGNKSLPNSPQPTVSDGVVSAWDIGLWDQAKWDASTSQQTYTYRQNVRAEGETLAVGCVIVSAGSSALGVELDAATLQIEGGEQSA